ncbi:hypothetical protein SAMN05421538_10812 [Paracoccus isoporae]|uniref:Glycosyl transferase family 8 n=1 Tax=Paracoccus isoporae TaxID=591205 RepID=A0A1G7DXJ4_9RHOB|nr:hypothetical protein [Paracoccus isoporae]SDE56131.1 hypothetical protein SAMN05421538_10812 [Paracoccus isoporae]
MRKTSYFFVMDGPGFQSAAVLLATSLRMQMGEDVEIIAYVPEHNSKGFARAPEIMLELLRIDVRTMRTDHVAWAEPYPHGNKIIACCEPRSCELSVFLDTDMICARPLDFSDVPDEPCLFAVPEGVPTWGIDPGDWETAYAVLDLPLPAERMFLVRPPYFRSLPYLNAGLVGFHENLDGGNRLPELWLDTALRLDRDDRVTQKRPWLDQIALPIAARRAGAALHVLPESYNYSLFRRTQAEQAVKPHIAHYHMPAHYRQWACCRAVTERALALCPERKRSHLRRHLGVFLRGIETE